MQKRWFLLLGFLVAGLLILAACAPPPQMEEVQVEETQEALECPEVECPDVEAPACPEVEPCAEAAPVVPEIEAAWAGSGHAASDAEAFRHWDEDDPAVVAQRCAKCHSTKGYTEYVTTGEITAEIPAAENMGIQCTACHNPATATKDSVVMPSGVELTGLGDESRCMECHQGRHSKLSVDASIAEAAGVENAAEADPDAVLADLRFANIHYFAAAATKYGTLAKGGYEYDGKSYDGNFAHVEEYDTCIECHDSHTLEVRLDGCVMCHGEGEPQTFRMFGSAVDYDGDGDMEEGMAAEISTLQEILYAQIQTYAADVAGTPIIYEPSSYPYFFIDTDGDGEVTEGEANYGNKYASWTPRLLQTAYNYQTSMKDPGAFAHGGKYIIQLLYDSIEDLGGDVAALTRDDHGHFRGSADAFRHWDEDGEVPARCARCHTATGLPTFYKEGVNISAEIANGFQCATCHNEEAEWPERYTFASVTFPSGKTIDIAEGDETGLCMTCHQGRASGASVAKAVGDKPADEVAEGLRFINVHYFAAGATRYGADVGGGYEYPGKEYVGYFEHVPAYQACTSCHDAHALEVKSAECFTCHEGVEDVEDIRMTDVDYDGDGDATEGIYGEIDTMRTALYEAIKAYSVEAGFPVVYAPYAYPYFFADLNADGEATPDEANYGNRYQSWTPALLEAAYNYQYAMKDPGGFAHNGKYVLQLLYDSIEAIGGNVSGMTRP